MTLPPRTGGTIPPYGRHDKIMMGFFNLKVFSHEIFYDRHPAGPFTVPKPGISRGLIRPGPPPETDINALSLCQQLQAPRCWLSVSKYASCGGTKLNSNTFLHAMQCPSLYLYYHCQWLGVKYQGMKRWHQVGSWPSYTVASLWRASFASSGIYSVRCNSSAVRERDPRGCVRFSSFPPWLASSTTTFATRLSV